MIYHETEHGILYCGDCLDILPTLADKSVDLVLTDPPFGIGNFVQIGGNVRGDRVEWNETTPPQAAFNEMTRVSKHQIIWGANFFNCFPQGGGAIVWVKNQPMPNFSKAEIASCTYHKKTELVTITWTNFVNNKVSSHPCERPVELYQWCLSKYTNISNLILDPFAGSGTTAIACIRLNRKYILIEKEEKYCEIAAKRIESELNQTDIFREEQ
jgi:site-specific DNA-methyltransferase (adenine-specific)